MPYARKDRSFFTWNAVLAQLGKDGALLITSFSKVEVPGSYITDPAATRLLAICCQ